MKIYLTFKSTLQSWGVDSPYTSYRKTQYYPTRSAIFGIIECAFGLEKEGEPDPIEDDMLMRKTLREGIQITIPKGQGMKNTVIDHQVVTPLSEELSFIDATGSKKSNGMPQIRKEYLSDAITHAIISGDKDLMEKVLYRLKHPVYPFCYGRAICIPSAPIVEKWEYEESDN